MKNKEIVNTSINYNRMKNHLINTDFNEEEMIEIIPIQMGLYSLKLSDQFVKKLAKEASMERLIGRNGDDLSVAVRFQQEYPEIVYTRSKFWKFNGVHFERVDDFVIRKQLAQFIRKTNVNSYIGSKNINSIISLYKDQMSVSDKQFDSNEDLIIFENGCLNIKTGEFRDNDATDFFSSCLEFDYSADSDCPVWKKFVNETFSAEVLTFLQEFAGYCLTTQTKHEKALWLCGERGSGKSTFIEGLQVMLGKRVGVLGLSDLQDNGYSISNISGKTLMVSSEQPSEFIKCSHILKNIISGEKINVNEKYVQPYDLFPKAKLVWAMEKLPRIKDSEDGLFRRIMIIEFKHLTSKRDPSLKGRICAEGAGIVNWALEGLRRLEQRGDFVIPQDIVNYVDDFQLENDIPRQFLNECFEFDRESCVSSKVLYKKYQEWCIENGHRYQSSTSAASDWKRIGLTKVKKSGNVLWYGIKPIIDEEGFDEGKSLPF